MFLVLLTLAASVAVVAVVAIVGFVDVAFHPPEYSAAGAAERGILPPERGRELFQWFSTTAERVASGLIAARQDAGEAHRTAAIDFGATERPDGEHPHESLDPGFCAQRTGVTPPEVLEMAEFLRHTQPADRVETIRREAEGNARGDRVHRCPLACEDGTCVAMPVRPISCRVHCALFGHELDRPADAESVRAAADGTEEGLRKAMTSAGLDYELYELNGALATALSVPDAAERWSAGDNPFADCTPYAVS